MELYKKKFHDYQALLKKYPLDGWIIFHQTDFPNKQ